MIPKESKLKNTPMSVEEIEKYVHQTKTTHCISVLKNNKKIIPYDFIKEKRNTGCTNRTSMSDEHIGMYSEDQLIIYNDDSNMYCFKYDETNHLLKTKKNPYNGKNLSDKFINTLMDIKLYNKKYTIPVYPLDKAIDMFQESGTCFRLPSTDKYTGYYISFKPIIMNDLPDVILVNNVLGSYNSSDGFISTSYDSSDLGVIFVYKVHTKVKIDFFKESAIKSSDISHLEKIFSSDDIETVNPSERSYKINDHQTVLELKNFMHSSGNLSNPVLKTLKYLNIKEFFPIKAYRGLSFHEPSFINRYKVGDKFVLYSKNRVQSWSSTHCVSEHFASFINPYGILVSVVLDPDEIAIDTRFLDIKQLKTFFWREQREIITVPFDNDGKEKKFLVTVEAIIIGPKNTRITDIKSMKYFSGIPDKDIDIMDYKIGLPITYIEAFANFFNTGKHIDLSGIPNEQKGLVSNGIFTDPISMEEVSIEFVVQLKQCGTLMSRESLDTLIESNKSIWQKEENISFKSPITNTIYGNLVLYNYNDEFLPQKNGIFYINVYKSHIAIKDTKKSLGLTDWYEISYLKNDRTPYIFRSTSLPVKLYYPQNDAGTKIVTLMCDCFKKGNLFAFDSVGRVRHGRVHKKTTLESNEFGYPDDTYEMRVTGELMNLGSTSYTVFFGKYNDPIHNIKFIDPYPDEHRWIIEINPVLLYSMAPSLPLPDFVASKSYERIRKYLSKAIRSLTSHDVKISLFDVDVDRIDDDHEKWKVARLLFEYAKKNGIMRIPELKDLTKIVVEILVEFIGNYPDDKYLLKMYKTLTGKDYD